VPSEEGGAGAWEGLGLSANLADSPERGTLWKQDTIPLAKNHLLGYVICSGRFLSQEIALFTCLIPFTGLANFGKDIRHFYFSHLLQTLKAPPTGCASCSIR
jgi:hypothetical protein